MSAGKNTDEVVEKEATSIEISVLVPFYNEEENIEPLYQELVQVLEEDGRGFELVFVNDGSSDGTADILDRLAASDARVIVIHLVRNFGQTAAMSAAIDRAAGDLIVGLDGDRQNDPRDIPKLLKKLNEGYDVVSGWRSDRKDSRSRTLPSQVANWLISRVSGVALHDYGCSLKAYRHTVIKEVRLYGEMHRFIPIYTAWMGGRVTEMVVNHRPRVAGKSKYGMKRIFKVILDLILVRFLDRYMTKPIHFFGGAGIISILLALLSGFIALMLKLLNDVSFIETPLPLLSAMLLMIGLLLVMMGILAELIVRTYFEGQNKTTYRVRSIRTDERNSPASCVELQDSSE